MTWISVVGWGLFSFILGSIPFSVLLSNLIGKKDARDVGDHNPGAVNALKAGGPLTGLLALLLDVSKGALPVGVAYFIWQWRGWELLPIALAPIFGHAFSPFLKLRGGKALAVSLGIWIGLTLWQAPVAILVPLSISFLVQKNSAYAVLAALTGLCLYLVLIQASVQFWCIFSIQALLLIWKHRQDLLQPVILRKWFAH
jgi:acyl phosphate:glycerol-3-phosphate acyltransferase